jgi:MYXO-CTERM domain-containing protein
MATRLGSIFCAASLAAASVAGAVTVTVDYDGATAKDFVTTPYYEKGVTTTVDTGHYDFYANPTGSSGDLAFNIDDQHGGPTRITITAQGLQFDALSMDVINPADPATGEGYTISAIGGPAGSMAAPATTGPLAFGPQFQGITALVITQTSPGSSPAAFTFDNLTIRSLPEPSMPASLGAAGLALFALHRRRAR